VKYVAVTSFSQDGYEKYGRNMIASFMENPIPDCQLWVYSDSLLLHDTPETDLVHFFMLDEEMPSQVDFELRHNSPVCHGKFGKYYDYRFDAVRFSHKPATLAAAANKIDFLEMDQKPEVLIWFDGDTLFKKPIPHDFLGDRFPIWAHVGHFPRNGNHTEAGVLMFRLGGNVTVRGLLRIFWQVYVEDQVYRLPAWTDCHVLDALIAGGMKEGNIRAVNLGDDLSFGTSHPIVNSVWREYVDHLKGDRKDSGASYPTDVTVQA